MSEKFTREQAEKMRCRQIILEEKLMKLNNIINGRGCSFYPFIKDEKGKITDEKTDKFISELINSLKNYRSALGEKELDETAEEAYRYFLYYACYGLIWTEGRRRLEACQTVISETFADIIDFADDLSSIKYGSYDEFIEAAYENFRKGTSRLPHFLMRAEESLQLLGYADPFMAMQPREVLLELCGNYAEKHNISNEENSRYISDINDMFDFDGYPDPGTDFEEDEDSINAMIEEYAAEEEKKQKVADAINALGEDEDYSDSELLRGFSPEELEETESRRSELSSENISAYWRNNIISDQRRFFNSCDKFIRLYFSIDRKKMLDDITHMTDTFLFEHKLSAFSFGKAYGLVTYQLGKMQDSVEKKIERAKIICR